MAARLIDAGSDMAGLNLLGDALQKVCAHRNFIVFAYEHGRHPRLICTNRDQGRIDAGMADYARGLYALDPFFRVQQEGGAGLHHLADVAPSAFAQSEFFRRHYRFTDVVDEVRFLVPVEAGFYVHVFIERETGAPGFNAAEITRLKMCEPLVLASVRSIFRSQGTVHEANPRTTPFNLSEKVQEMAPKRLTVREIQIVELMLKGHSVKSIARLLDIEGGTVTNHKRNIYAKLNVHSQAQLFDLFLRSL